MRVISEICLGTTGFGLGRGAAGLGLGAAGFAFGFGLGATAGLAAGFAATGFLHGRNGF